MSKTMKLCSIVLSLVMCLSTFGGLFTFATTTATATSATVPTAPADSAYSAAWDGTTVDEEWASAGENAYYITSAAELAGLAKLCDAGNAYTGYTFYITKHINLAEKDWDAIGDANTYLFNASVIGCLDGEAAGHTHGDACQPVYIKGLNVDSTKQDGNQTNAGFIGTIQGGQVLKNLVFLNPVLKTSKNTYGVLFGYSKTAATTIENIHTVGGKAYIKAAINSVGGIGGYTNCPDVYRNCSADMEYTLEVDGASFVSGIVGQNKMGNFYNCTVNYKVRSDATLAANTPNGAFTLTKSAGITGGGKNDNATYKISVFENCKANVDVLVSGQATTSDGTTYASAEQQLAGINCYISGGGGATYTNCVTTGQIVCVARGGFVGSNYGGIAGSIQGATTMTGCVSTVDLILEATGSQNVQAGGLVGNVTSGSTTALLFNDCYYGGRISTGTGAKRAGGFVGILTNSATFTNCQMDGIIDSPATQNGAVVGRWDMAKNRVLTFENVVVTGISANSYGYTEGSSWIGLAANYNSFRCDLVAINSYSAAAMPFAGRNDFDAAYDPNVTGDGASTSAWSELTFKTSATDAGETVIASAGVNSFIKFMPASLNGTVTLPADKWVTAAGKTPVLKNAENVDRVFDDVDLSWFTPVATKRFELTDAADIAGLALVSSLYRMQSESSAYSYVLPNAETLAAAITANTLKQEVVDKLAITFASICVGTGDNHAHIEGDLFDVKYLLKDASATGATVRLVGLVTNELTSIKKVGFQVITADGQKDLSTQTVYSSVLVGETAMNAAAINAAAETGAYIAVVDLGALDATAALTVRMYMEMTDGTIVYGDAFTDTVADMVARLAA